MSLCIAMYRVVLSTLISGLKGKGKDMETKVKYTMSRHIVQYLVISYNNKFGGHVVN